MYGSLLRRFFSEQEKTNHKNMEISWNSALGAWVVLCPEMAGVILRSSDVLVYERRKELHDFAAEKGVRIDSILRALAYAPLANNGEAHKVTRKQFSAILQPRVSKAVQAFRAAADGRLDEICGRDATVDLFDSLILPAMNAAIARLGGKEIDGGFFKLASPSQIFGVGQKMSGPRLRSLEEHVSGAQAMTDESPSAIAMTLFAGDPTLGSLAETIIEQLERNRGAALADIDWAPKLTRSGLPFVERQAARDFECGGTLIRKGDRIAIYLGAFGSDGSLHFGAGAHTCLGKALAEQLWSELRASLSGRTGRMELLSVAYREADFAFTMPIQIMTRVTR
jgi:cytochrome P450